MAYLRETLGIKQAGYRDTIAVRAPDNVESAFFKLPDDDQFAVNVGDVPPEIENPSSTATSQRGAGPDAPTATEPERSG